MELDLLCDHEADTAKRSASHPKKVSLDYGDPGVSRRRFVTSTCT